MAGLIRLDALLSRYGYCSRSEARTWVKAGRVCVNGVVADSTAAKAHPGAVLVDGEPLDHPEGIVALLNKPAGFVCSHDETEGPSIYDLLPPRWRRRNPPLTSVGRLDKDVTGAVLLTDRGELVHRLTSPKNKVPKVYEVKVSEVLPPGIAETFSAGQLLLEGEERPCLPAKLEIIGPKEAILEIIEGRYHQVKRMFASQGCPVLRLHRLKFGDFQVDGLKPGEWRIVDSL